MSTLQKNIWIGPENCRLSIQATNKDTCGSCTYPHAFAVEEAKSLVDYIANDSNIFD